MELSTSSSHAYTSPFVSWKVRQWLFVVALGCLVGRILVDPTLSMYFYIAAALLGATIVAVRSPIALIGLLFLTTLVADNLVPIIVQLAPMVDLGPFNVHAADPFIFGMIVAIGLSLTYRRSIVGGLFIWQCPFLSIFLLWLGIGIARGLGEYGINAVGEARTYYAPLLVLPYLATLLDTAERRARAFRFTIGLCLAGLIVAALRGLLAPEITLGVRILSASGALALLFGVVGSVTLLNRSMLQMPRWLLALVYIGSAFTLFFTAHRSVWMAMLVCLAIMALMKEIGPRYGVVFVVVGIVASLLVVVALRRVGHDPVGFLIDRAQAFVSPREDPTTNWRLYLWEEALKDVRQHPLAGMGFGRHFELQGPGFTTIYTSPHNLFVTLLFEVGYPGLLLYLAFVCSLLMQLLKSLRKVKFDGLDRAILVVGVIALIGAHVYYVGYALEWVTWVYAGIAMSVVTHRSRDDRQRREADGLTA